MKLLGTNDDGCVLPASGVEFKPYYKKPTEVSKDGKTAIFKVRKEDAVKYRFVTVPKTTRYENVVFMCEKHTALEPLLFLKRGSEINILCFDKLAS